MIRFELGFGLVVFAMWVFSLVAGRPAGQPGRSPYERAVPQYPEYDRPGRAAATAPDDDEDFLRRVRERAEEQRRAYRQQRLQREREQRDDATGSGGDSV